MYLAFRRIRFVWAAGLLVMALVHTSAGQQPDIQKLVTSGKLEVMRWPNFSDYRDLAPEILRADWIRSCLVARNATGSASPIADRSFQGCREERA